MVLRREGEGDNAKITVSFPGHGLKKLVAKFAELKVEEMNTKNITDKAERKKVKRTARKKAAPKQPPRLRRGPRLDETQSEEDGQGPEEAVAAGGWG